MLQIQGGFLADLLYISPYVSTWPASFILVGLIYLTLLGNEYYYSALYCLLLYM